MNATRHQGSFVELIITSLGLVHVQCKTGIFSVAFIPKPIGTHPSRTADELCQNLGDGVLGRAAYRGGC